MNEFNGTPGPWVNVGGWVDAADDGPVICKMSRLTKTMTDEIQEHNATLIAAAPELLEACQRSRSHLYQAGYEPKEKSLNPNEELLFQLNAAIGKALAE